MEDEEGGGTGMSEYEQSKIANVEDWILAPSTWRACEILGHFLLLSAEFGK